MLPAISYSFVPPRPYSWLSGFFRLFAQKAEAIDLPQCIAAIEAGDEAAFRELYLFTRKDVFNYCVKLSRSAQAADEITQNVYLAFWNQRDRLQHIQDIKPYLLGMAARYTWQWFAEVADRRRIIELNDTVNAFDIPYEEAVIDKLAVRQLVEKCLEQLPPRQQQVFRMIKLEGFSYEETAASLSISEKTVSANLQEAMKKVKKYLPALTR